MKICRKSRGVASRSIEAATAAQKMITLRVGWRLRREKTFRINQRKCTWSKSSGIQALKVHALQSPSSTFARLRSDPFKSADFRIAPRRSASTNIEP
jgi:hypothetical protein